MAVKLGDRPVGLSHSGLLGPWSKSATAFRASVGESPVMILGVRETMIWDGGGTLPSHPLPHHGEVEGPRLLSGQFGLDGKLADLGPFQGIENGTHVFGRHVDEKMSRSDVYCADRVCRQSGLSQNRAHHVPCFDAHLLTDVDPEA